MFLKNLEFYFQARVGCPEGTTISAMQAEGPVMRGMEEGGRLTTAVLFGRGRWDPVARRLEVDGAVAKLPWRAAECLQTLLEAGGEIVPREELEQAIWGGALVEESNLAQCVALLRKALDPAPEGGSHIETVARVGYRIAVRIERETEAEGSGSLPVVQSGKPEAALDGNDRKPARRWVASWLAAALIAAIAIPLVVWGFRRWQRAERIEVLLAEGFDLCRRGNRADANEGSQRFSLALKLDPENALALAGLAESGARAGKYDGFQAAAELARRAVNSDPDCAECHAILGWILMTRGWRWAEAGLALERALQGAHPPPQAVVWRVMWLAIHRRLPEALKMAQDLAAGRPELAQARVGLAMAHFFSGNYRKAIEECRQALVVQPRQAAAHYWMSRSSMQLGDDTGALDGRVMEIATWDGLDTAARSALLARFHEPYRRGGRAGLAQAWIDEVSDEVSAGTHRYNRAVWYAWMGQYEAALKELEAGVESRPFNMIYTAVDPAFEPLRSEPRFQAVLRGIGLE
jgi:DNA-binding winged helix-turn-helix (wHTH) protein/Tfp pilus assembly protein PilF